MNNKLKPALMAGGLLGLLLVITVILSAVPILGIVRCCNCLWPIGAGVLATMFYVKSSPSPATLGDGAILGALAGAVGGLIYMLIGMPLFYVMGGVAAMSMQVRQFAPDFPLTGIVLMVIAGVVGFVLYLVLATIGGLIGVPIFEKRKGNGIAPPPPQNFAGGPGT
jgi:hypothetical protein